MSKSKIKLAVVIFMLIISTVSIVLINRWISEQVNGMNESHLPDVEVAPAFSEVPKSSFPKPKIVKIDPLNDPLAPRKDVVPALSPGRASPKMPIPPVYEILVDSDILVQ